MVQLYSAVVGWDAALSWQRGWVVRCCSRNSVTMYLCSIVPQGDVAWRAAAAELAHLRWHHAPCAICMIDGMPKPKRASSKIRTDFRVISGPLDSELFRDIPRLICFRSFPHKWPFRSDLHVWRKAAACGLAKHDLIQMGPKSGALNSMAWFSHVKSFWIAIFLYQMQFSWTNSTAFRVISL
jgi:hypothetical protein